MSLPPGFDGPHVRTEDDPLDEGPICSGCKEDWPCDYVQGYRAALTALRAEVEGMVTGVDSMAWGSHEVWVDGESHLLAKAVLAAIDRALGEP